MLTVFAASRVASDTAAGTVGFFTSGASILVTLLWVLVALAAPSVTADEGVALSAQPRLCVIAPGDELCQLQLRLSWTAEQNRDVCLKLAEQTGFLQCWQARRQGDYTVELTRENNISVLLQDAETGQILSQIDIPVIKRDLRDTRRRRRHAWSIF